MKKSGKLNKSKKCSLNKKESESLNKLKYYNVDFNNLGLYSMQPELIKIKIMSMAMS